MQHEHTPHVKYTYTDTHILVCEVVLIVLCPITATGASTSAPPPGTDRHYISGLCCLCYQLCGPHHLPLQEEVMLLKKY